MNVTVRGYISQFRVRELQAVLEQLGLPRTGRKADLVARIFAFFGEEPPTNPRYMPAPSLLAAAMPYPPGCCLPPTLVSQNTQQTGSAACRQPLSC
jgi:SAP domain